MHRRTSQRLDDRTSSDNSDEQTTRHRKIAVAVTLAIPFILTIAYGGVDTWALIPLSLLTLLAIVFSTLDSLKTGLLTFSSSALQLPVGGLLVLAAFQLLPIADPGLSSELPNVSASASLSMDASATSYFAIRLLFLLYFFTATLAILSTEKRIERIAVSVITFGSIMAFVGILQRLASPEAIYGMRPSPQAIPFGPFVNQHHFAAFMEMTIGLTLAFLLSGSTKSDNKALYLIALILMLIAVTMTGSRGGMISIFAVISIALAASFFSRTEPRPDRERSTGPAIIVVVGAIIVIVGGAVVYLGGADLLVRGIGLQGDQSDPTSGRMHFWGIAWKIFLDHPVIGAGFDAFGVAFTRYDTWNGYFRIEQAHNDYLQMLADGGVIAFACIAAFIYLLVKLSLKQITSSDQKRRTIAIGAFAGCCGILVHSIFDFPLRTPSNSYFFLLLAALATVDVGRAKAKLRRKRKKEL